jgi:hypothetical protein
MVDLLRSKIVNFDINVKDSEVQCILYFYELRNLKKILPAPECNGDNSVINEELSILEQILKDKIKTISVDDKRREVFDIIMNTNSVYEMLNFINFLVDYYQQIKDPQRIEIINNIFQELRRNPPKDVDTYILFLNSISDRLTLICGDRVLSDQFKLMIQPIMDKLIKQ